MFVYQKSIKPNKDCQKITNIVVGRSVDRIRLFVTCLNQGQPGIQAFSTVKIYEKIPKGNDFFETSFNFQIEYGSQPYISDLNGDFLEDILYNEGQAPFKLKVAFQTRNPEEFVTRDFDSSLLVTDETEGCL